MTNLKHNFNGNIIEVIQHNQDYWLNSQQIAQALEYPDKRAINKIYSRNKELLDDYTGVVNLTTPQGTKQQTRIFNEEGVMLIAMKSQQPKAVSFQKWAVKVLKEYRLGRVGTGNSLDIASYKEQILNLQQEVLELQRFKIERLEADNTKPTRRKPKRITQELINQMHELKEQGISNAQIAKQLGSSPAAVSYVMRGYLPRNLAPSNLVIVNQGGVK